MHYPKAALNGVMSAGRQTLSPSLYDTDCDQGDESAQVRCLHPETFALSTSLTAGEAE